MRTLFLAASLADRYVAALVAHDPSKAPMAPDAKFTEQTKAIAVGQGGLWKSAVEKDGTTSERPMNFAPFDLEAAHIFKIYGDKIHEIEAMGFVLPLDSKNGWYPFTR